MAIDCDNRFIYPLLSDFREIDSIESLIESNSDLLCYGYMPGGKVPDNEAVLINMLINNDYLIEFVITERKDFFYIISKPIPK